MGKNNLLKNRVILKAAFAFFLLWGIAFPSEHAKAVDLPLASSSPMVGVPFDDRPLALPVQRNFQMAMLTASSELGRSCGRMEAYGWRMNQSEQQRVNDIFNTTVDHLHGMGFVVESQAPTSVSRDITMFTADRGNRHFIFMWSAGELGLVMVLCETSQPMHYRNATASTPSVQVFQQPKEILQSTLDTPPSKANRVAAANFSPVGDWVGSYTCEQGFTGGTLQIAHLKGENFDGYFRFYPTPRNPYVATGRYSVYGQYDHASQRILINPGKWLQRPKNYYNTIMVGSFDPINRTFSAYFQGINGCTSFEAKAASEDYQPTAHATKKRVKKKAKKKVAKKKEVMPVAAPADNAVAPAEPAAALVPAVPPAPDTSTVPAGVAPPAVAVPAAPATVAPTTNVPDAGIVLPAPTAPVAAPTPAPAPSVPAAQPAATEAPVSITPPSVAPPAAPAQVPPPAQTAPPAAPTAPPPQVAPSPATTPEQATKPSGALEPKHSPKLIQVADSGQWFTPTSPQAQQPSYVTPIAPAAPQAPIAQQPVQVPLANVVIPNPPQVPPTPIAQPARIYDSNPPTVPAPNVAPTTQTAPEPVRFIPTSPAPPPAQTVPDYRPSNPGLQGAPNSN